MAAILLFCPGIQRQHTSSYVVSVVVVDEHGATLEDLMVTIHPHPTLSEAMGEAAMLVDGKSINF